jgi:hypothetical protein
MKKLLLGFLALVSVTAVNAQVNKTVTVEQKDWRELMQDPNANFYDVQNAANAYWATHDTEEKGNGFKPYKRWEAFMEPRVYPSGNMYLASQTWQNYESFLETNNSGNKVINPNLIASTTWTAMGPFGAMTGSACGLPRKAGRDNFITFHPTTSTTYWVGAPAGGLWKTTNDGVSWTTNTDNLSVIGCSDLAIDPTNANIMYMATGDGDAGDTYCIGVLKSTDGGATWNPTGLVWTVNQQRMMRRLIINPSNPQILIAASSAGIWRTANGGTSWTQVSTINAYDLEFKPTDPNTVYAGGGATGTTHSFYLSTNGGTSFAVISNGIPTTGCNRMGIAVTLADPNYVYVIRSNSGTNGFASLHRSTASGTVFTQMSTTPDVLANSCVGTAGNGQGWYDLAIASSPLNRDEVVVGGINHWRSTNGGSTWTNIGCWNSTGANPPYVHADVHEIEYTPAGTMFSANDGGIYKYTGTAWTDLSSPRNIAQQYRIGLSGTTADYWITGHQDNGSNIRTPTTYSASYCGDGMDCFIDRTNNMNVFSSTPQGGFRRSTNGGIAWTTITAVTGTGNWVSPWHQDPVTASTLYAGKSQLWRSTDLGATWTQLTATGGSGSLVEFAVAPSNNQVIYVIHGTGLFKTINGGTSWTSVNTGLPANKTYISIDPTDANNVWVTASGYTAGSKVFMTTNGGTSWTNVSTNLPNLPANCIVYEPGTSDRIYVGMDVGVYYKDNSTTNWTLYNTGLPNTVIADLEISPANPTKLYAATYGRGVYKVDVVTAAPPVSSFSVASTGLCAGTNISFTDQSVNAPTSWSWSVTPAAGVTVTTPTLQSPTMNFTSGGTYTVSMQATNIIGPGSVATQTVIIVGTPTVSIPVQSKTVCAGSAVSFTASGATTYSWTSGGGTGTVATYTPASLTVYTVTGTTSGCSGVRTATAYVNALPTVTVAGATAICAGGSAILTGSGASTYTWNTGPTTTTISVSPTITTTYSVVGTGTNGCTNTATKTLTVNPSPTISTASSSSVICLGSNASLIGSGASTYTWMPGSLTGATVSATPTINTTYTVIGTSAGGCTNIAVRSISVNPLPTISTSASQSVICAGQTTTLTGSGGSTYIWNPGSISGSPIAVTPASSITYTCIGTGTNGCSNTAVRSVTVNPLPTITATTPSSLICGPPYQGTATINASGASTYTWLPGSSTGNSIAVTPSITTTYTVIGTSTTNCTNSNMITITVSACTGINEVVNAGAYSIYPNPTSGKLTIQAGVTKNTAISAEVIDASGKLVLKQNLNFSASENAQVISISNLANGLYFIKLTNSENKTETIRIVKE